MGKSREIERERGKVAQDSFEAGVRWLGRGNPVLHCLPVDTGPVCGIRLKQVGGVWAGETLFYTARLWIVVP